MKRVEEQMQMQMAQQERQERERQEQMMQMQQANEDFEDIGFEGEIDANEVDYDGEESAIRESTDHITEREGQSVVLDSAMREEVKILH